MKIRHHIFLVLWLLSISACFSTQEKAVMTQEPIPTLPPRADVDPKSVPYAELMKWSEGFSTSKNESSSNVSIAQRNQISPDMPTNQLKEIAEKNLSQGSNRIAKAYFHELIRRSPENEEALLSLSLIYLADNETTKAFKTLMHLKNKTNAKVRNNPEFIFRYRYALSLAHLARSEYQIGHEYLSKLIAEDSTFIPAYTALAGSYIKLEKYQTAEFILKRGIELAGSDASIYSLLGVISRQKNQIDDAESWFNKALNSDPNYGPAMVNRATISMMRFEYEQATIDTGKALSLNPYDIDALTVAALILERQDQKHAASDLLKKVIDLDPLNSAARFNLALIEEQLQNTMAARQLIEEVLQLERRKSALHAKAKLKLVELAPDLE